MLRNVYIISCSVFVLLLIPYATYAYTFTRSLSIGDIGQDVYELQKFLNTNPFTQVGTTGAGSPGNETTYFGTATRRAVARFQNLNAPTILAPLGLNVGTGFFGQSTIDFINQNQNNTPDSATPNSTSTISTTTASTSFLNTPVIQEYPTPPQTPLFYPLVTASHPGKYINSGRFFSQRRFVDKDFMVGSGFQISDLDFYLGTAKMRKSCRDAYVCTLWINKHTRPGTYTLSTNNPELGTHEFKVVPMSVGYPTISTRSITLDTDTVISGRNFTDSVKVYTIFGTYTSEAKNNSFILNISSENLLVEEPIQGILQIENSYGLKSTPSLITYEK